MISIIHKKLKFISVLFITLFCLIFCTSAVYAQIAVLKSNSSSNAYMGLSIGNYNQLWSGVITTLNYTNIKFSLVSDDDLNTGKVNDYKILILPLIENLSDDSLKGINNFTKGGGKIIVIFPGEYISPLAESLAESLGIQLDKSRPIIFKSYVNWIAGTLKFSNNDFLPPTVVANAKLTDKAYPIAVWDNLEENSPAVTLSSNGSYIAWRWGIDGNQSFNMQVLKNVCDLLVPGILDDEQVKLDFKEFTRNLSDIDKFNNDTYKFLYPIINENSNDLLPDIQEHIFESKIERDLSKSLYQDNNYQKAQDELAKARFNSLSAFAKASPSYIVEGRTLWLDRGTLVDVKTPEEMALLFDKIQKIGINLVYLETLNSGYTIYPSKITEQNPLTVGWDPLYWAVKCAHERNIELHAWTWIFAVGNTKHNPIIGKSYEFPGPILSKNYDLSLLSAEGNLIPTNQHEFWVDPANTKARKLILSLLEEIVREYDVDGVQLDYIRYPFQSTTTQMGFDIEGRQKFEIETGYSLDRLDDKTLNAWNQWKVKQVSKFVKDVSTSLKKIKPDIKISAAVFGGNKQKRVSTIQQDWETWVNNGWIDIVNPMIYASNTSQLAENLDYFVKTVGSKALIYPGISVKQLDETGILEQIYLIKDLGLIGNTIFAMAHLGPDKSEILSAGPYRNKKAQNPSKDPILAANTLIDEYITIANSIKNNRQNDSLNYYYLTDSVITEAEKVKAFLSSIADQQTYSNIDNAVTLLQNLENMTQEWMNSESQIKTSKIKQLVNYVKEARILLSYEQHKRNLKEISPSDNTNVNFSQSKK